MDRKKAIIKQLKEFKKSVSRNINVDKMLFFGSRVTGKFHRDSDIDLVVVSERFNRKKFYKRAIPLYDYWNLDYPVDFLCYTPSEFKKLSKRITIVREAVKEGIEI